MKILRTLLAVVSLLLGFQGINATGRGIATREQRELQSSERLFSHVFLVRAVYGFTFEEGSTPGTAPTQTDINELLRLTEIYYRRNLATAFPGSIQNIELIYHHYSWEPAINILKVDFDVSTTFQLEGTQQPTEDEVWNIIGNIDSDNYIKHVASLSIPEHIFLWTNSAEITSRPPTSGPTPAPTLDPNFIYHILNATAVYEFVFGGKTPELALNETDMSEVLRLSEIFYRRNLASAFPTTYHSIGLTYLSHNWDPDKDTGMLTLDFNVFTSFNPEGGEIPTERDIWNIIGNFDSTTYINNAAKLATPPELFLQTASVSVGPLGSTLPPAFTWNYELHKETTPSPTFAPPKHHFRPNYVPPEEQGDPMPSSEAPEEEPAPTSDSTEKEPMPTPTSGTPEVFIPSPTAASGERDVGRPTTHNEQKGDQDDQHNQEDSPAIPEILNAVTDKGASGINDLTAQQAKGDDEEECKSWIFKYLAEVLTAANMLFWMGAVHVMYYGMELVLQKWGRSYHMTTKKLHLISYWVQFCVYLPLLAVVTWSLISMQNEDKDIIKMGLFLFANAAMLLLSLYGMEIFVRSMDKTLMAQRIIFMATLLYLFDFHDSGLQNPIDQVTFGAFEALGACSELATQWLLIHYRSWADGSPMDQDRMRPGTSLTLHLSLICSFLAKTSFLTSCLVWYVLRFHELSGSSLVYLIPLVRIVQAPTLIRSFSVQTKLYYKVANTVTGPPQVVNLKADLTQLDAETVTLEGSARVDEYVSEEGNDSKADQVSQNSDEKSDEADVYTEGSDRPKEDV